MVESMLWPKKISRREIHVIQVLYAYRCNVSGVSSDTPTPSNRLIIPFSNPLTRAPLTHPPSISPTQVPRGPRLPRPRKQLPQPAPQSLRPTPSPLLPLAHPPLSQPPLHSTPHGIQAPTRPGKSRPPRWNLPLPADHPPARPALLAEFLWREYLDPLGNATTVIARPPAQVPHGSQHLGSCNWVLLLELETAHCTKITCFQTRCSRAIHCQHTVAYKNRFNYHEAQMNICSVR
ncbi:hypothetical protein N658DRAFT_502414 [Parathielavia hyrcaniae]|uniref:Uncharacterized protein n=1 Tax=Parathielavia hyrcaniae TaxID=113614 RepID=A0AAN6SWA4_9PEZI|nr:hypothetical protein N658DRAFT_502414 [Parathielavia hyrcaniae]